MKTASAWAPANISCVFQICKGETSRTTGSCGMGFTIDKGATVKVSEAASTSVFYNGKKINFPTVESVIEKITKKKVMVRISSELSLGTGFGMSGACALAAAYALNKLLKLKKSKKGLAMIAHCAEVEEGTGLGDVVNQHHGGFLVKFEPSFRFRVRKLGNNGKKVYYASFGKISTKRVINDAKAKGRINKAGMGALVSLKKIMGSAKKPTLGQLISISRIFSEESQLLKDSKVKRIIEDVEKRGGHASMIMLGNAVFSDIPFKGAMEAKISNSGAA